MSGFFDDYNTLGYLKISFYEDYKYYIENTFEDISSEEVFFLYLVDKVMAGMDSHESVMSVLGEVSFYIEDYNGTVEEVKKEFSHFEKININKSNYEFSIKQELRCKDQKGGYNLYINTSYSPKFKSDVYSRFVSSTILYMMDFRKRAVSNTHYWNFGNRFADMLRFYDDYGYPSTLSLTEGPSHVLSEKKISDVVQANT